MAGEAGCHSLSEGWRDRTGLRTKDASTSGLSCKQPPARSDRSGPSDPSGRRAAGGSADPGHRPRSHPGFGPASDVPPRFASVRNAASNVHTPFWTFITAFRVLENAFRGLAAGFRAFPAGCERSKTVFQRSEAVLNARHRFSSVPTGFPVLANGFPAFENGFRAFEGTGKEDLFSGFRYFDPDGGDPAEGGGGPIRAWPSRPPGMKGGFYW